MTPEPVILAAEHPQAHSYRTTLVSQAIRVLCKVASVVIIARLVSPQEHGYFAMAASVFYFLVMFRDAGLGAAAVQARAIDSTQMNTLFGAHVLLGMLLAAAMVGAAFPAARFFGVSALGPMMETMSAAFVIIGAGGFARSQLSRNLRFGAVNFIESMAAVVGTIAMIAAGAAGAGAYAFVVFLLTSETVATALAWRELAWRPSALPVWGSLRDLYRIGTDVTVHQFFGYALQQLDTIAIGRWFGAFPLGLYNRAGQLLAFPQLYVSAPLSQVLLATLSRLPPKSPEFGRHAWSTVTVIAHLVLPFFGVCIVLPAEVVRVVLGPHWPDATPLIRILAIGGAAAALTSLLYAVNVALGRTRRLVSAGAIALPLSALAIWLGAKHGVIGIATGVAAVHVALVIPRAWWLLQDLSGGFAGYLRALRGPILATIIMMTGLWLGREIAGTGVSLLIQLLASFMSAALMLAITAVLSPALRREWQTALHYLPQRVSVTGNRNANRVRS